MSLRDNGGCTSPAAMAMFGRGAHEARDRGADARHRRGGLRQRARVLARRADFTAALDGAALLVDALFGIGQRDALPDDLAKALEAVNARGRDPQVRSVAVDVPTGVDADSGAVRGTAFRADLTVTFGLPKQGLYLAPGLRYAGRVEVVTLGLDETGVPDDAPRLIGRADAAARLPRREADAHKGDAGSLLLIGGSANYIGAPVLAAEAALRVGVGLATLAVPRGIVGPVAAHLTEATYLPLPEADWGVVGPNAAKVVAEALGRYTALQVGNGLGREDETGDFLGRLFGIAPQARGKGRLGFGAPAEEASSQGAAAIEAPVLFDADGLNWLSTVERWWETLKGLRLVLTPHPGEMARLRGVEREAIAADPWGAAREAARAWGQVVVLKGGHTVAATPDGDLWVAPLANPALAAAGTGDTLAGTIAGLLTQGLAPADAAILGLYLGSRAGDLARADLGTLPLIAGDLPAYIARAIRELE